MPVYQLDQDHWFPPLSEYEEHGVVAVGGDVSPERLLLAYQMGIFPWYNEGEEITWWSPNDRMILKPREVKTSKSMRNILNQGKFEVRFDTAFDQVIEACKFIKRADQDGTWLNSALMNAMKILHQSGLAHSVECWEDNELVGGLYGISLGKMFVGESMFSKKSNASKFAFIKLCQKLEALNFDFLDCQVYNDHLASLGAYTVPREEYISKVLGMDFSQTISGSWKDI